jgi:regulator of replication initiation timing
MDAVQQQIVALSHKVDSLYQMIDHLSQNVSESLSEIRRAPVEESNHSELDPSLRLSAHRSPSLLDSVMEHKDVLMDSNTYSTSYQQNSENSLSADLQVQRLTAQLTAAYNRIAALEEQLLSRRIHS